MPAMLVRDLRANLSLGMDDDEFERGMEELRRSAPQEGERVAGAFARSFSRQLGQAFRTLPHAEITADSSDAEIKITTLRESLRELASKRIGIDIDSAAALGEMRAIRSELEDLAQTGDIVVRADVARAVASLDRVEREVEKLDGQTARVDVDMRGVGTTLAKVGMIDTALTTLQSAGPMKVAAITAAVALVPAAAAAAAGAVTAVLGGALAALGLAASQGSATAQAAIERLKVVAKAEAAEMGKPFERVWVTIVDVAQRELAELSPTVRNTLADLAPDVESFVDQAGDSLGELTPALDDVERAFSMMLQSLGPALPDVMHNLADGITKVTGAVAENPEVFTRMVQGLAGFVEWAGWAVDVAVRFVKVLQENADAVQKFFSAMSLPIAALRMTGLGMVDVGQSAERMTQATQKSVEVVDVASQRMKILAEAYGLVGDDASAAVQKMTESWSAAYAGFTNMGGAIQTIEQRAKAGTSGVGRQADASERLAEVQRTAAEKIQRAQRQLADTHERAAERVKQAQSQLATAHERAAEQVEQAQSQLSDAHEHAAEQVARAQERVRSSQEALASAVEAASRREADAAERVEDARRRAAQVAEDSGRKIAAAAQRVGEAQEDAAQRVVDAERRLQDSHARTEDAVEDLTRARERAQERLDDLARSEAGTALDEEGAQLAIERARQRLKEINTDPKASDLDRREADLAYRQSLRRLEEVRQRNADLREELADARAAGVEGSSEVVQAKERIAQAQQAELDAEANLAKAREEGAKAVAAAEQALADARRDAARQAEEAERNVARAEAELNQVRVDGARDVLAAKQAVVQAEKDAAKAAQDAARDVADAEEAARKARRDAARDIADAEEGLRKAKREAARDIADAEAGLTKARQDAARDVMKANREVADSWTSLGGTVAVTTEQFLRELEKQVKDQEEWAENLISLAGRVPDAMLAELAELGPGGAQVVALAAEMSDKELRRFIDLHARSGKEAGDVFAKNLRDAGEVLREIARQRGEEVADKVREGMNFGAVSVIEAARRIGLRITQEIGPEHKIKITANAAPAYGVLNQLLHDIGVSTANVSVGVLKNADGNIIRPDGSVMAFASGAERHVAQIGAPGAIRVWNEPEAAGEAYIPLALSKRARSEEILARVAEMFGGMFIKGMPAGSMPIAGGDGAAMGWGGITIGQITLAFADDRDMYAKGAEFAAGLREYARRGGVLPR